MSMTTEQIKTAQTIGLAVLESIESAGELGAPSGVIYAGLMSQGCTLSQYTSLMAPLERRGFVCLDGDCYTITQQGKDFMGRLKAAIAA